MPAESRAAVARQAHLRGAHADVGPRLDGRKQSLQPARMRGGVVIQNSQERSARFAKGLIDGRSKADVAIVRDHADPAAGFAAHACARCYPPRSLQNRRRSGAPERPGMRPAFRPPPSVGTTTVTVGWTWPDRGSRAISGCGIASMTRAKHGIRDTIVACIDTYYTFSSRRASASAGANSGASRRNPAAHQRRRECRSVLVAGRASASFFNPRATSCSAIRFSS